MNFLYNVAVAIYHLLIRITSLFSEKARLWIKGRKNIWEEIAQKVNPNEKNAWIHVSSLGEFEQGRPVVEEFKKKFPHIKLILTFYSPSGYEVRKNFEYADVVLYLPGDTPPNARRFIEMINPVVIIFVKYDFWYNYMRVIAEKKIPMVFVSCLFRKQQQFFKWYGTWFRNRLKKVTHFYLQDEATKDLLHTIGIDNVTVCGDTRIDRVYSISQNVKPFPFIKKFCGDSEVIVAGSSWPPDEDILIELIETGKTPYKLIVAPHEVDKAHIDEISSKLKVPHLRYSEIESTDLTDKKVLIIDCLGILSHLYQYGSIGYIGGGFGEDTHNTQEPATFGLPVIFGPKYHKFRETKDLVRLGGAFPINNYQDFSTIIHKFIKDPEFKKKAGSICRNYILENVGATEKILNDVGEKYL